MIHLLAFSTVVPIIESDICNALYTDRSHLPSICQWMVSLTKCGTTSVKIGMGGRYFACHVKEGRMRQDLENGTQDRRQQ